MSTARFLWWLELSLLAAGVVLAAWCATIIIEARYYHALPIPPAATAALPGEELRVPTDTHASRPSPPPPVEPGGWIARLEAPSVHMSATVLEGSDDGTLAHGAGHIEDTALPGDPGNFGIAGHRDTTFRPVRHLHVGDPLTIATANHIYRYRITRTMIVNPQDVSVLDNADHPTLTLVTCYPFEFIGHAPRRFIVSADLIGTDAQAAETAREK
jgi:LPXTG-site transpeptidase (sortase) family protein